jgi:hypothetical protein
MKSVYTTEIEKPCEELATFYADPAHTVLWMDDLQSCDLISGARGMPGSRYRFIPKKGMGFIMTIVSKNMPNEVKLFMEGSSVNIFVTGRFYEISQDKTRFISEEVFSFKGIISRLKGMFSGSAIRKAHRRHMESFKAYVESIG